ncbi:MAG TPA: hypothetical protein VK395_17745 [Gemmataceae bacterium]|nr:hypothetical protein [Gemmataceae bacterium]
MPTPAENQLSDLIFPPKTNAANERLAQHLWAHRDDLFTFLRQPGLDATDWRAELAIRFGVILRKVCTEMGASLPDGCHMVCPRRLGC